MNYRYPLSAVTVVVALILWTTSTTTQAALVGDEAIFFNWASAGAGTDRMAGWLFTTNRTIQVNALGVFDHFSPNGLLDDHRVVIWDDTNQIIADTTVPAGTAATKIFRTRYVEISPLILAANREYLIAAQYIGTGRDDWQATVFSTLNVDPAITLGQGRFTNTSDFVMPTQTLSSGNPLMGPNFLFDVPQPASLTMLGLAGLLLTRHRRPR